MISVEDNMLQLRDDTFLFKGDWVSVLSASPIGEYLSIDIADYMDSLSVTLDEGQVNELYEYLGRWIDVQGEA